MALASHTFTGVGITQIPEAPAATFRPDMLFNRQEGEETFLTCGYWSFEDRTAPFSPYNCGAGGGCYTHNNFAGCRDNYLTTCYESDHSSCFLGESLPYGEQCCTGTFDNCITVYKSEDDDWYTAFLCARGMTGTFYAVASREETTQISTNDLTTVTVVRTQLATASGEGEIQTDSEDEDVNSTETTSTTEATSSSGGSSSSDDSGSSDPPVGAIVGGVIGGVALILLVAFGAWYIRFQKRKQASRADVPPGNSGPGHYQEPKYAIHAQPFSSSTSPDNSNISSFVAPQSVGYYQSDHGHQEQPWVSPQPVMAGTDSGVQQRSQAEPGLRDPGR